MHTPKLQQSFFTARCFYCLMGCRWKSKTSEK